MPLPLNDTASALAIRLIPGIIPSTSARLSRKLKNLLFVFISYICYLLFLFTAVMAAAVPLLTSKKPPNLTTARRNPKHSFGRLRMGRTSGSKLPGYIRKGYIYLPRQNPTVIHLLCCIQFQAPHRTQKGRS